MYFQQCMMLSDWAYTAWVSATLTAVEVECAQAHPHMAQDLVGDISE